MTFRAVSKWANLSRGEMEFLIWTKHSLNAVMVVADMFLGLQDGSKIESGLGLAVHCGLKKIKKIVQ